MTKPKLEKLEGLRGFAAAYVMAGHIYPGLPLPQHGLMRVVFSFGQEAVICFFLLSGFVIYYATHFHSDHSFHTYLRRRTLRIFPVFLLALAISYAVGLAQGRSDPHWGELFGNLVMFQDFAPGKPGVWVNMYQGNVPLWSLSYEWWFYMMFFPIYRWIPANCQLRLVAALSFCGLISYAIYPNQISLFLLYFLLWWTGLELARTYASGVTPTFATQRASVSILGGFCVLVPLVMFGLMPRPGQWSLGLHPFLEAQHFGAAFVILCGALLWAKMRWRGFAAVFGGFTLLAPISYAIYVFHYPLCVNTAYLDWIPWPLARIAAGATLTLVLAYLVEVPLQRAINRLTRGRVGPPAPVRAGRS